MLFWVLLAPFSVLLAVRGCTAYSERKIREFCYSRRLSAALGPLLAALGALLAALGPLLVALGPLLAALGALLARFGPLLGRS